MPTAVTRLLLSNFNQAFVIIRPQSVVTCFILWILTIWNTKFHRFKYSMCSIISGATNTEDT